MAIQEFTERARRSNNSQSASRLESYASEKMERVARRLRADLEYARIRAWLRSRGF